MGTRTINELVICSVVASLLIVLAVDVAKRPASRQPSTVDPAPTTEQAADAQLSLNPQISVGGASPAQAERLELAVDRFSNAGLKLPDLDIRFSRDQTECGGSKGRFSTSTRPWRISICTDVSSVYEHELAHAWERANLSDQIREQFMELRGHEHWWNKEVPWNQRGMEDAAFIIQQGLSGLPLPPALSREHRNRLAAFELLTGSPDPRLVRRNS